MNAPESTQSESARPESVRSPSLPGAERPGGLADPQREHRTFEWWHHSHPTFAALTGFFSGMLFVTAVPGAVAGILRLVFGDDRSEELFPWMAVLLIVPIVLLAKRKTRRFGQYMAVGMVLTALVVAGVASLALYFMVRTDG